jgi:hypothetical protein
MRSPSPSPPFCPPLYACIRGDIRGDKGGVRGGKEPWWGSPLPLGTPPPLFLIPLSFYYVESKVNRKRKASLLLPPPLVPPRVRGGAEGGEGEPEKIGIRYIHYFK